MSCVFFACLAFSLLALGDASAVEPPSFDLAWGSYGSGTGEFNTPVAVAVDPQGNVYTVERYGDRVQKFTGDGDYITSWGGSGSNVGRFREPHGITVDDAGFVYVADSGNHRIQKFTGTGTFLMAIGSAGSTNGRFDIPRGVAVDKDGNIYVADTGNDRMQVFNAAGSFLRTWGMTGSGPGQFDAPVGIAIDSNGDLYVGDLLGHRVQKFTEGGDFLFELGGYGSGQGQFYGPVQLDFGPDGLVYVAEAGNYRVQVFSMAGTFVMTWGTRGSGPGEFEEARGVAVDGQGRVFVADVNNHRIQRFSSPGPPPRENVVILGPGQGLPGPGQRVPVSLENKAAVRGLEVVITDLPDGFTVTDVEMAGRASAMSSAFVDNGAVHLLLYSAGGASIPIGSGKILDLVVTVNEGAAVGDTIRLVAPQALLSLASGALDTAAVEPGFFAVQRLHGDVTGDNHVDLGDVVRLIEIILGTGASPTPEELAAADCNGDGALNVADVTCLVDLILLGESEVGAPADVALESWRIVTTQTLKGFQLQLPPGARAEGTEALYPLQLTQAGSCVLAFDPRGDAWVPSPEASMRVGLPPGTTLGAIRAFGPGGRALAVSISGREVRIGPTAGMGLRALGSTPNPFRGATEIRFSIGAETSVEVKVFDARGALVSSIPRRLVAAGEQRWTWSAQDGQGRILPAGIYFARLEAGAERAALRLVLLAR